MRGKLFEFKGNDWSERGLGLFKLNVAKATPEGTGEDQKPKARFLMHQQLTGRVVLNTRIFKEMSFSDGRGKAPSGRLIMFSVVNEGKIIPYMLRVRISVEFIVARARSADLAAIVAKGRRCQDVVPRSSEAPERPVIFTITEDCCRSHFLILSGREFCTYACVAGV